MKLKVRKTAAGDAIGATSELPLASVLPSSSRDNGPSSTINDVHKVRGKAKGQARWLGWLLFVVLAGLLVGAQYYVQQNSHYLGLYQKISWSVYGLIYLIVLMFAAEDSYLQAILCALVPCYVIFYAFTRMESNALRGTFLAVVVSIGAEIYYLHDQALLLLLQKQLNLFIENVGKLIQDAGKSPDIPQVPRRMRR